MLKYLAVAKILKKHKPSVDNEVLRLHYRFTFLIFFIASTFVTAKEFFGAPIDCITKNSVPGNVLNIYCFIMSTFSVPKYYAKPLGEGVAFPGLGLHEVDDEIVYHAYYQWVPLVLFMQAMLFYIPRFIWKQVEGGLFNVVLGGLDQPILEEGTRQKKHKVLSNYMLDNLNMHTFWAWRFFFCEALSFVIVIGNIYFTDFFLGGTFLKYGSDVIEFSDMDPMDRVDPMTKIFPTVAKCNFRSYGPSGTVEIHDTMCVLAVNIINQKIYILLWFWMVGLAVLTGLWLVFRILTIVSPSVRGKMLQYRGRMAGMEHLSRIQSRCGVGDWFLLEQLGQAMEPTVYGEFLRELSRELETAAPRDDAHGMLMNS